MKAYRKEQGEKVTKLVVRKSTDFNIKYGEGEINQVTEILRDFVKGDIVAVNMANFQYGNLVDTVKKDTLWLSLIDTLNKKMQHRHRLKNEFTTDIQLSFINRTRHFRNNKTVNKNWVRFYRKYPTAYALVEFSEVANDGERAIFYFAARRGGLWGRGDLILFHKIGFGWKFLGYLKIWVS
ncbi:MAG: hypothetical protein H7Y04_05400 [Verrucomicrobia bacterium]|nr:hypothetical protein [Cytophagales bacterium]